MARDKIENVGESQRGVWLKKPVYRRSENRGLLVWAFGAFVLFWLIAAQCAQAQKRIDYEAALTDYVAWFHQNLNDKRKDRALEKVPLVIKYANKYGLDPLLLACIVSLESSWKTDARGSLGERGLLQIMPGRWAKRFDLSTAEGQLDAGAYRLRMALTQCRNDLEKALTHYACGRCVSKSDRTKKKMGYRYRYFKRMAKKFVHGKITRNQNQ